MPAHRQCPKPVPTPCPAARLTCGPAAHFSVGHLRITLLPLLPAPAPAPAPARAPALQVVLAKRTHTFRPAPQVVIANRTGMFRRFLELEPFLEACNGWAPPPGHGIAGVRCEAWTFGGPVADTQKLQETDVLVRCAAPRCA